MELCICWLASWWKHCCGWDVCGRRRHRGQEALLHRQHRRVYGLFAGDGLEGSEDSTVILFVALHRQTTFLRTFIPDETNIVLFGLAEGGERSDPEGSDESETDGGSDAAVNVATVADFSDCTGGDGCDFPILFVEETDAPGLNDQLEDGAGLNSGERAPTVFHFVGCRIGGKGRDGNGEAKQERERVSSESHCATLDAGRE